MESAPSMALFISSLWFPLKYFPRKSPFVFPSTPFNPLSHFSNTHIFKVSSSSSFFLYIKTQEPQKFRKKTEMGFAKEEKSIRVLRFLKTLFFLITMLISFLLFSVPVLLAIADTLLPFSLLSASLSPSSLSFKTLSSHLNNYDFRYSLIDIPLISITRSAVIICK